MTLSAILFAIVLTCIVIWLWRIAYNHAGKLPESPPLMIWILQAITIVIAIVVVGAIWGFGGACQIGDIKL